MQSYVIKIIKKHCGVMMNQKEYGAARKYVKVTDDQRSILIDVMEQSRGITLKDACELLQMNYESCKAIWTVYKKDGRKKSLKTKKHST